MPSRSPAGKSRAERLKAALRKAKVSHEDFAQALGVTYQHLRLVVTGRRISPRILDAVDAVIAEQLTPPSTEAVSA